MSAIRVTAPYVTVTVAGRDGPELRGFYATAVVVDPLDADQVARLLRKGMVEEVDAPAAEEAPDVPADEAPPADKANGRPTQAAPKAEWVAYAVAQRAEGVSEEDAKAAAEAKSKADLIAEYGG